jgi:signal transduction histidine kinase
MGRAATTKLLQHCRNCSTDPNFKMLPEHEIGSLISVPILQSGGRVLGVLNISHPQPEFFTEWHERFLLVYCNCLGQLLVSHRLLNHMELEVAKRTNQLSQALEESQAKGEELRLFKTIIDSSQEGVTISDAGGRLIYVNPSYERLFKLNLQEAAQACADGLGLPTPPGETWEGEIEAFAADGRRFPIWQQTGSVRDTSGSLLYRFDFIRDISRNKQVEEEKRNLEAQLNHAQKMEAIGQLAGGVAHDFNNILTTIIGYGHILLMKMDDSDPLKLLVNQIMGSSERAASLTQSLLTFGRKQVIKPEMVDMNRIILRLESLLQRLISEDIDFRTELTPSKLPVMADVGQLEQVLMNLAANARDAMPEGGTLTITTGTARLGREFIEGHGYGRVGKYARISVSDTGTGIDQKTMQRIFEPFFTTKEVGKGTGLGLAIAYGAVKQQNGYITVQSEMGKGTTFDIYLPIVTARREARKQDPLCIINDGTETILIAEDDQNVRRLNKALLEQYGYRVLEAEDGKDALDKFKRNKKTVNLLILDVVMPRMNGKEVFDEVKRLSPGMKVLFTSGYTADIISRKGIIQREFNFIPKPLAPGEFLKKVREVLDS